MSGPDAAAELHRLAMLAAQLLGDLSAEGDRRDRELQAHLDWWADGYRAGFAAGSDVGYGQAEHDMAQSWRSLTASTIAAADPDSPQAREGAYQRILATEEGCRADARQHWREFMTDARRLPQAVLDHRDENSKLTCPAPVRAAAEMQGRRVTWKWQTVRRAA